MSQHTRLHKYIELIIGIFVMSIIGSYRWPLWYSNLFLSIFPLFMIYCTVRARRSWKQRAITIFIMSLIYCSALFQRLAYEQL